MDHNQKDFAQENHPTAARTGTRRTHLGVLLLTSFCILGCNENPVKNRKSADSLLVNEAQGGTETQGQRNNTADGGQASSKNRVSNNQRPSQEGTMPSVLNQVRRSGRPSRGDPFAGLAPGHKPSKTPPTELEVNLIEKRLAEHVGLPIDLIGLPLLQRIVKDAGVLKLRHVETFRHMFRTKHYPGQRRDHVRWVWAERGNEAVRKFEASIRAAGWLEQDQELKPIIKHPTLGHLTWSMVDSTKLPTMVDVWVDTQSAMPVIAAPTTLFANNGATPLPIPMMAHQDAQLMGYEFGRFHYVRRGARFTDVERLLLAYELREPTSALGHLKTELAASGFEARAPDQLRFRDQAGRTVRIQRENQRLLVHYQHRWQVQRTPVSEAVPR